MFRSLAISSSLLALLASGPVMAMEDRDENDRKRNGDVQDSPLGNSSKRVKQEEAKEEKPQPQAINKKLNDIIDAVKEGHDEAKLQLGKMLRDGVKDENGQEIVKKDRLNAIKWLKAAADKGHEKAKVALQQVPELRPAAPAAVQQNTFDVRHLEV